MSIDALITAAQFVDYLAEAEARGEKPRSFDEFIKNRTPPRIVFAPELPSTSQKKSPNLLNSVSHSPEEVKEKKKSNSGSPKDAPPQQEHSGTGTREVHNKLEKNRVRGSREVHNRTEQDRVQRLRENHSKQEQERRAHLKECFENLKKQIPAMEDKKTSNLSILRKALQYIQTLKKRENEYEHKLESLAREKITLQRRLLELRKDCAHLEYIEPNNYNIPDDDDNETTTTASECGNLSDFDDSEPPEAPSMHSAVNSDYTSSSSSSTTSTVLVGPHTTSAPSATPLGENSSSSDN